MGNSNAGFTLTEILVSMSILIGIMTILVTSQSKYVDGASIQNLTANIGLSIKEAQSYGISVKEYSPGGVEFPKGYGVIFDITSSGASNSYILFADRNDNGAYDSGWSCPTNTECIEKSDISYGNTIQALCYILPNGTEDCSIGTMVVTFIRPETEAHIKFYNASGANVTPSAILGGRIKVVSTTGIQKSVVVYGTGQVSIQ